MNPKGWNFILIAVALLLVMGLDAQNLVASDLEYYVGFLNNTSERLDNADVYYGDTEVAASGILVKGGRKTMGPSDIPIPTEADVRWDQNGKSYSVKAKLEGIVPKDFTNDDTIYFVINTNNIVDVHPIKFDDIDALVKLVQSTRPKGEYEFGFVNKTHRDLQAVSVYYGDHQAGDAGDILSRVKVGYSDKLTLPIPAAAEVRWSESGVVHTIKVKLEGVIPRNYYAGTIFFVINTNDTVEVKPVKWSDDQGSINLVK